MRSRGYLVIAIFSICNCGGVDNGSNGVHNGTCNEEPALSSSDVEVVWMRNVRLQLQVCEDAGVPMAGIVYKVGVFVVDEGTLCNCRHMLMLLALLACRFRDSRAWAPRGYRAALTAARAVTAAKVAHCASLRKIARPAESGAAFHKLSVSHFTLLLSCACRVFSFSQPSRA